MHQPDSDHKIETIVDGERVRGTVHYTGSADITVRLEEPGTEWSTGVHMPGFARPLHPEGFLGAYGQQRALELLTWLYKEHKRGDRRRKIAGVDYEEFGRVRYLRASPGDPDHERTIREQAPVDAAIYVQIEDDGPYGLARFYDSGRNQPFLAEAAVYDDGVQKYVEGVQADPGFRDHLETVRRKLLPDMQQKAARLKAHKLNRRQVRFLSDFGDFWRAGKIPLKAADLEHLIDLGYLTRDRTRCANEVAFLEAAIARSRAAQEELEAQGNHKQAAQCVGRIRRLRERIEMKSLRITPAGKAAAQDFPGDPEFPGIEE